MVKTTLSRKILIIACTNLGGGERRRGNVLYKEVLNSNGKRVSTYRITGIMTRFINYTVRIIISTQPEKLIFVSGYYESSCSKKCRNICLRQVLKENLLFLCKY